MSDFTRLDAASVWIKYQERYDTLILTPEELEEKYTQITNAANTGTMTGNIQLDEFIQSRLDSPIGTTAAEELKGTGILGKIVLFGTKAFAWITDQIGAILTKVFGLVGGQLADTGKGLIEDYDFNRLDWLWQKAVENGLIDAKSAALIQSTLPASKGLRFVLSLGLYVIMGLKGITSYFNTAGADFQKKLLKDYTPSQLSPTDLVRTAMLAPGLINKIRNKLLENGLAKDDQDLMFLSRVQTLGVGEIRQLFLRGEITDTQLYEKMRQLGFTDSTTDEIVKLFEVIPPIGDLITMVAKEAFEPAEIARFGLDDEFPGDQSEWFLKHGLNLDWQHKYWQSHWNQISIGQGFEMLHRGIITEEELNGLFKTQEIPPFWRDKLIQMSYNVLTRVDIRRMYDLGVLSEAEILKTYQHYGYSLIDAGRMTEFTIKYYEDDDKNLTRSQIETYYREGLITEDDASAILGQLGYADDRIIYLLAYQDFLKAKKDRDDLIGGIEDQYVYHIIDEAEAKSELYKLNLLGTKVNTLIGLWGVARLRNRKLPSKTDFDKFFRKEVISLEIYMEELSKLGYSQRYIQMYSLYILTETGRLESEQS